MNRLLRSFTIPLAAILLILSSGVFLSSCRTSRQESRRPSTKTSPQANGQTATLGRQMDSLLIIEEKLLEVIDSMTGLVKADHSRIRELEREVRELSAAREAAPPQAEPDDGVPLPPTDSHFDSDRSTDPPPPPVTAPMTEPPPALPPPTEPPVSAPPPSVPPTSVPPDPATNSSSTPPAAMQARYSSALREYNENNYEAALTDFQSLERDDPNGTYSGNYKYWEGECYYAQQRYNMAMQTFGSTLSEFPNSTKAAAAQFKIGECYEKLNIPSSARQAYERVIADFPSSEYKARAQARLKALSN